MTSKNELSIGEMRKNIDKRTRRIRILMKDCSDDIGGLIKRIEAGERSEDAVRDFCMVCYRKWDRKTELPYRELCDRVEVNQGEPVLVVEYSVAPRREMIKSYCENRIGGVVNSGYYDVKWEFSMGKINGDLELVASKKKIYFPSDRHIDVKGEIALSTTRGLEGMSFDKKYWKSSDGGIKRSVGDLPHLVVEEDGMSVQSWFGFLCMSDKYGSVKNSEVLIGEDVEKFFEKKIVGKAFYKLGLEMLDGN